MSSIALFLDMKKAHRHIANMSTSTKRKGTALWFPDVDGDLLRAVAKAEDRPIQWVMSRALRRYAETSPEYQATTLAGLTRVARKRSAASGGDRS